MCEPEFVVAAIPLEGVTAIAVIDDAFESLSSLELPAQEREAVMALLDELEDPDVVEDFSGCGFDLEMLKEDPYSAIEALTSPERSLGNAYVALSGVSESVARFIDEQHAMRSMVEAMRKASGCDVVELAPNDDLNVKDKQLVFIDYYLEKGKDDGDLARDIASRIEQEREVDCAQQIVLMSSVENVRTFRRRFRSSAGIQGSAFSFVAKDDLDEPWKVRAHLEMFAGALPHSQVIGDYISCAKMNVEKAAKHLWEVLDDLDLGDFAYIQKLSLQADGHPLGDYLSWLFSTHLAALAFEYDLREKQAGVDKIEFKDMFISPAEPSIVVAKLYQDALFARNVGELGPHPRAAEGEEFHDVPLVGLGDVFLDAERTIAVVVLSADCDLAFAPNADRNPDPSIPVLLVEGKPRRIDNGHGTPEGPATELLGDGSEVFRIDWNFKKYRTVALGDLERFLVEFGADVSQRDRLRPLYALKLQHDFGKKLLRPGHPVAPPFRKGMEGSILKSFDEVEEVDSLDDVQLSCAFEDNKSTIRITPALVGRLQTALSELRVEMQDDLTALGGDDPEDGNGLRQATILQRKVEAIARALDDEQQWKNLLGDIELPKLNGTKKLTHGLYMALGHEWRPPGEQAIVLHVLDLE